MTHEIKTEKALRDLIGNPVHELVVAKTTPIITAPIRRYIERSPFVCLATCGIDVHDTRHVGNSASQWHRCNDHGS